MASNPIPAAPSTPAPKLGERCPSGHEYAQRSETNESGAQAFVVFCPACEPLAPPAETPAPRR